MQIIKRYYLFSLLCVVLFHCTGLIAQQMEEFNGPFPSWANVKLSYGAKGNGIADDTKAIQQAIDGLGTNSAAAGKRPAYTVLYLPAGTYCISASLLLKGKIGISIIGENPSNTIIKWIGPDAGTMFWADGSAYYKISRFTWDANQKREIEAIGIHWRTRWNDGKTQSYASLNIEISDNIFTGNCKYGISGGTNPGEGTGHNDSEITIKRCLFQNCSGAGIITTGYNALDYWIWDCRFINCNIGINSKYGNFHAYRSYFKNSKQADVTNTNGYYKSMRGCYSEDSRGLSVDSGAGYNPFKRIYQANTVMRPKWIPIQFYHIGKLFFIDNFFDKSTDTSIKAFVKTGSGVISANNSFRDKQLINFVSPAPTQFFNDVAAAKLNNNSDAFLAGIDKTPAYIKRQVYEVPPGADASTIQQIINTASKLAGKKPVVHFPVGTYKITNTISIPAGSDLQISGDGYLYASVILAAGNFPAGNALIKITGPSNITIRELQIGNFTNNKTSNDAIQFVNSDQQGSRAFIDQLYAVGNKSIRADDLDYLYIQKDNSFFADNDLISGGPQMQAGKGTAGLYGFGGQFAGVSVQKNARVVLKDCWWEGNARVPLNLSGSGNLTIDGAMIAPNHADSNTTIAIGKFNGKVSLLNMYIQGGIEVNPDNPGLSLLLMNANFYHAMNPLKFVSKKSAFKGVFTGLTTLCFIKDDKKCDQVQQLSDRNNLVQETEPFILSLLADDRFSLPQKYQVKNAAASNILISRVSIGDMNNAIRFSR
ncbi:MAG: glycosyl hydrolase family 28-related protein [Chitinophagaceae bacterium]